MGPQGQIVRCNGVGIFLMDPPMKNHEGRLLVPASLRNLLSTIGVVPEVCILIAIRFRKSRPFVHPDRRVQSPKLSSHSQCPKCNIHTLFIDFGYAEPLAEVKMEDILMPAVLQVIETPNSKVTWFVENKKCRARADARLWER